MKRVPVHNANPNQERELVIHVVVSKAGRLSTAVLLSGDKAVISGTTRALKQWVWKPYIYNGKYVAMEGDLHLFYPTLRDATE